MGELAVGSVRRGVDDAEFDALLDSLVHRLSDSLGTGVAQIREMLLGDDTARRVAGLRDSLIGAETQRRVNAMVAGILNDLLGEQTRSEMANIRDELLGDALRLHLAGLRDELTGPVTEARLAALARSFVLEVGRSYADTLRPQIRADIEYTAGQTRGVLNWLKENIQSVIWIFGLVAAGLIILAWYFRQRKVQESKKSESRNRMVEILTSEIDQLRDTNPVVYEQLKDHVQTRAINSKVEKPLREILEEQGILRSQ